MKQEKNWTQISKELDIPRRSLYNMRHTEGFQMVADDIWMDVWADIAKLRSMDGSYNLIEGIKAQFKMFQMISGTSLDGLIGSSKLTECNEECPLHSTHVRRKTTNLDDLFHHIQLTAEQWRLVEEYVTKTDEEKLAYRKERYKQRP